MASSKFASLTDAQKAATRQRLATKLGREYQGYKPGGDPRAAQRAVMATAPRPASTPMGGAAAPVSGMGAAGGTQAMMRKGGAVKKYARGGGIESKGKTRGKIVKMASGGHVGSASKRADGIASKGKTRGKMC